MRIALVVIFSILPLFAPACSAIAIDGSHVGPRFDPDGDGVLTPSDVDYLVAYLFAGGPAPCGWAGPVGSGDGNGDGVVDPADIFYAINLLNQQK